MSRFEKFMLWLGFVRAKRVLKGMRVIGEPSVLCAVGYGIFDKKYISILKDEILQRIFAFNASVSIPLTEGKMKSAAKVRKNTMPIQPPPSPAGKPDRRKNNETRTKKLEWQRKRNARLREKYQRRNPGATPLRAVSLRPKREKAT